MRSLPDDTAAGDPLARAAWDYLTFRKLRISDIENADVRGIFMLSAGSGAGFHLFDGMSRTVLFFGYFRELLPEEVVARTRSLFGGIDIVYERIREASLDPARQVNAAALKEVLDRIRVEILVSEDCDTARLGAKIGEFQPTARQVEVKLMKPSDLQGEVERERTRMRM